MQRKVKSKGKESTDRFSNRGRKQHPPSTSSSQDGSKDARGHEYPALACPAFSAGRQAKTPVPTGANPRTVKKRPVAGPVVPQPMGDQKDAEVVVAGLAQPSVNQVENLVNDKSAGYNELLSEVEALGPSQKNKEEAPSENNDLCVLYCCT